MICTKIKRAESALIIGCGDIGLRLARLWQQADGGRLHALTHSAERCSLLEAAGITPLYGDLDHPDNLPPLPEVDTLFYFAPPPGQGSDDPRMDGLLKRLSNAPKKFVYISTSGVYGDCQGKVIDEHQPVNPGADRSRRRLAAERSMRSWADANACDWVILRVSGIYGPGRLPLARLAAGMAVLRPEIAPYSNRIHSDDLAQACLAAAAPGKQGIFNISDGCQTTMSEYFITIARLAGLPAPELLSREEAETRLSPEMLSYLNESRRMSNHKMVEELGVTLRHADLESGEIASLN